MNNKELKPCPFCGGETKIDKRGKYGYGIVCISCGANSPDFQTETNAIKSWNDYANDLLKTEQIKPEISLDGIHPDLINGLIEAKRNYLEKQDSSNSSEIPNSSKGNQSVQVPEVVENGNCEYLPEECCKDFPSWYFSEWNHQFNFSTCRIYISQSACLDFTVRRANNDLNTDKWEAYSELVNCVHDTQLSEEQIIFGVSRKEAIEKCDEAIKQMGNGFLELYNKNRKVEL